MGKFKKQLSSLLAILFITMSFFNYVPVKAAETIAKIAFLGVEHSPLVVGDSQEFYLSAMGAEKVQYRVFQNKIGTDNWEELTLGYTNAENANAITTVKGSAKYEAGKYKLSIWVKKADTEGKFKNKNGSYDSYYTAYLNCVNKDDNNRVYTNGDIDVEKNSYVVGETVKVNGIKDISGMKDPYTYKLHVYDVDNNQWKFDKGAYRKDLSFVADKPGTYVLDVWAMSSNSTLWARETELNGRIYEAWKLKVITVTEKIVEPEVTEVNIKENGTVYGSQDAINPMEINKKINITANEVVLNNIKSKGDITITGDNATLNNVKVEGSLILNPGEKGTVNLNNVTADVIEVLSGASNSIHFNNVNAKVLNINSRNVKESVRVEIKGDTSIEKTTAKSNAILEMIKGSFGIIEILENQNKTESIVELRGNFDKNIIVKTKATLRAAKDAKVSKVVVEPANNEKITFDGNFGEVELNKLCTLITALNSTIVKLITNSPATLELGKGSIITTLDQKGKAVTQIGTGTVQKKLNVPPAPSSGGGSNGGSGKGNSGNGKPATYSVTSVSLDKINAELLIEESLELKATINPDNATNKKVTWTSSDPLVATVTSSTVGKANVKAIGAGTAIITVKTEDGGKTAICTIKVAEKPTPTYAVTGVSLNKSTADLKVEELLELTATITPDNATNKNVTWTSSDPLVATVTGSTEGKATVKAKGAGMATITVKTEDGGYTATSIITVTSTPTPDTELNATVKVEENKVTVFVDNIKVANQEITITMYNKKTGELVYADQLTANSAGKGSFNTILSSGNYYSVVKASKASLSSELKFVVSQTDIKVEKVSLDTTVTNLTTGQAIELTATINPGNATNKNVTWTSSDPLVATVVGSTGGKATVTAVSAGMATITVKTEDGGYIATCIVTVTSVPTPVTELNATVAFDENKVTVSVDNIKVANQEITITMYNKANADLVYVDQLTADSAGKGKFSTILAAGEYYGVVKAAQASLSTELKFVVEQTDIKVEKVSIDSTVANLTTGQAIELTAVVNPSNATNQKVTWTSSNEAVATVIGSTGTKAKVTAISAGTTTITVTTEDGQKTATCEVIVTTTTGSAIELNAAVKVEENKVTVSVDNIKAANQEITITMHNKTDDELVYIDQLTADSAGKGAFSTILKAGEYYGVIKASKASLSTEFNFVVVPTDIKVEKVSLDSTVANLTTGQAIELTAVINPSNATNQSVTWESSNEKVATVTVTAGTKAKVTGISAGTTTITVTTADGQKTATCEVTVTTTTGSSMELNAVVDVVGNKVTVSVDNNKVADQEITIRMHNKVNDNVVFIGQLTADSVGKVTFNTNLSTGKYYGLIKASKASLSTAFDFEVVETGVKVEKVTLNDTVVNMTTGQAIELTATINPSNATNQSVTWESSNEKVATVTGTAGAKASITAISAGTATITVTTADGQKTATCEITVTTTTGSAMEFNAVVNVEGNKVTVSVDKDKVADQEITIRMHNKANDNLVFIGQLTADSIGKVAFNTNLSTGKYYGLVKASKASLSTTLDFEVVEADIKVENVTLNDTVVNLTTGQAIELTATINPSNATNQNVIWSSSNGAVATVTGSTGTKANVTAISAGTTTITVTTEDGEKIATCIIKVVDNSVKIDTINVENTVVNLTTGQAIELTVAMDPSDEVNQNLTWSSSDEAIATVTGSAGTKAKINAISEGTVIVTVITEDGEIIATYEITVTAITTSDIETDDSDIELDDNVKV